MTSRPFINTRWLLNFPEDKRVNMANVYIETMGQDLTLLQELLPACPAKIAPTLSVVHRIKGSAMQIGLRNLSQSATYTEDLGKLDSPDFPNALSILVKEIQQSIIDVRKWKSLSTKRKTSTKLYSY